MSAPSLKTEHTLAYSVAGLQSEQPEFCASLMSQLSREEQEALLEVCRRADTQDMLGLQSPFPISRTRNTAANGAS